jgi:hypothetical protein
VSVTETAHATGTSLAGFAARNRIGLALAGVAGVSGLALYAKSRGGARASQTGGVITGDPQTFTGAGAYDSTANDVYSGLQAQIEGLGDDIAQQILTGLKPTLPAPAPRPAPPTFRFPRPTATAIAATPYNGPQPGVYYPGGYSTYPGVK